MKGSFVQIKDTLQILSTSVDNFRQSLKDNFLQTPTQTLRVDIVATHAGRITRNWGFYLPQNVKDGSTSWTDNYGKPMLVHHDSHSDPVGRIVAAKYVDTSNTFGKDARLAEFVNILCDRKISFIQKVRAFDRFQDSQIVQNPDFPGLGYIVLTVDVTDADAIKKVLDKRYLTVSIGATTDKAVCSICNTDWTDDLCDHRPGKDYEGKRMFLIAGKLKYEECSFVNNPADPDARIITVHNGIVQNSIEIESFGKDMTFPASLSLTDSLGGFPMDNTEPTPVQNAAPVTPVADANKPVEPAAPPAVVADELSDEDKHYEAMIEFGYQLGLMDTGFEDAKLTPEKRKSLQKSTFCKPGERKYPVPDCSHARSAMAYAKKYNEPSSVLACIRRKAKALGCPFDEAEIDAILADEAKRSGQTTEVVPAATDPTQTEESCECCKEQLDQAAAKLTALQAEFDALKDSNEKLTVDIRTKLTDQIIEAQKLAGVTDTDSILKDIAVLSMDDLIKRTAAPVAAVAPKQEPQPAPQATEPAPVTPNTPTGTVEDPTLGSDSVNDLTSYEDFAKKYNKILDKHGDSAADAFLKGLKQAGLVPVDFKVQTN